MNSPGVYNLGDVALAAINAATVSTVVTAANDSAGNAQAYLDGLDGMLAASLEANFTYGSSGGTSIKADIFTTLNQGTSWVHVARFAFTTASAEKVFNLSGLTPRLAAYTPVTLGDDVAVDGMLGPRWRASILTVGVYVGNAALSLRLIGR